MDYPRDYNAAVDFVDRHAEQGRGDKPAFIDPERTLTYGALRDVRTASRRSRGSPCWCSIPSTSRSSSWAASVPGSCRWC